MRIDGTSINGLMANQALFQDAASRVANVNAPRQQPVEFAQELPAMTVAEIGYSASARVISTQDEMSGELIDVLG